MALPPPPTPPLAADRFQNHALSSFTLINFQAGYLFQVLRSLTYRQNGVRLRRVGADSAVLFGLHVQSDVLGRFLHHTAEEVDEALLEIRRKVSRKSVGDEVDEWHCTKPQSVI